MEEISNLYQQSLVADTEVIKSAAEQLLSIYENPENIFIIIQLVNEASENAIKQAALVGLFKMMRIHWVSSFNDNQDGESIKEQLLLLFQQFQDDSYISNLIANCLEPIIITHGWDWEDLINFLNQTTSESTIKVVSHLLKRSLKSPENLNQEIIDFCISMIEKSINTNDVKIIIRSSHIFALLSSVLQEEYSESLSNFFSTYVSVFEENPETDLAISISKSFNISNQFFDADQLLMHLLELSAQSEPGINFIIIRKLISKFGKDLRERFPFLLQTTMEIISSLFSDECYSPENDSNYIAGITEKCAKKCSYEDFSELMTEFLSNEAKDDSELYSILLIIHKVVGSINLNSPALYNTIMEIISNSLNNEIHTIIELSLLCLLDIMDSKSELFEENAEEVFKTVLSKLDVKHQPIMKYSAKVIAYIMYYYKINSEIISSLLPSILQTIEETGDSIRDDMIVVIIGFIYQMQEEIEPYVSSILPTIISCTEDEDNEVLSRAIEALGLIIMYAPNECDSVIEDSIKLFLNSLERDDLIERAFEALTYVAKSPCGVDPFIEMALIRAFQIAAPNEVNDIHGTLLVNIISAIKFMDNALKFRHKACERVMPFIYACCWVYISEYLDKCEEEDTDDETIDDEILKYSIMAIIRSLDGDKIPHENKDECIDALLTIAESKDKSAVRYSFKAASYMIKRSENGENEEFEAKMMELAIAAIKRELPCQLSEKNDSQILANYDKKLFDKVIKFLSCYAKKRTEDFPSSELLELIISLNEKVSSYETEVCLIPFVAFEKTVNGQTEIDDQLFEFALSLVSENCATIWPFTILRLIINSNEIDAGQIENVVEICLNKADSFLSALSLLFVLASKHSFPFENEIQKMIESIPQKIELISTKGEIDNISVIFECIFSLIDEFPDIEKQFGKIIFTKAVFVIDKYKDMLPKDATESILQFIMFELSSDEKLSEQLSDYPYTCKLLESQQQS